MSVLLILDSFSSFYSLPPQILKLSYNKLREISSTLTFSGLTSLLRLYLDHNLLQHIHPRALLQLPSLRLLRLQGNRLHQLHPHTLCTLSLLNTYYFSTLRWAFTTFELVLRLGNAKKAIASCKMKKWKMLEKTKVQYEKFYYSVNISFTL